MNRKKMTLPATTFCNVPDYYSLILYYRSDSIHEWKEGVKSNFAKIMLDTENRVAPAMVMSVSGDVIASGFITAGTFQHSLDSGLVWLHKGGRGDDQMIETGAKIIRIQIISARDGVRLSLVVFTVEDYPPSFDVEAVFDIDLIGKTFANGMDTKRKV